MSEGPALRALLGRLSPAAQMLFDDPGAALVVLDPSGRVRRANASAVRSLGAACVAGCLVVELVEYGERGRLRSWLEGARGEVPANLAIRLGEQTLSFSLQPLGEAEGWLLRVSDGAAVAALQQELAEARRLQTLGQLAGGIAHDFNNLLTAVLGAAEAIAGREGLDPEIGADVETVRAAARRGQELVRQLLAVGRQQILQPRVLAIDQALAELAPLLRRLVGAQVRLVTELEQPGRTVWIDPGELDRVIVNLVTNAREAMADGGTITLRNGHATLVAPRLLATGERIPPGRWVTLEVADTGRGIPPELVGRIFEPFFTTRRAGTGLGLATVHGIVRQSGGLIEVESSPQGSLFRIWLPRHEPDRMHTRALPAAMEEVIEPALVDAGSGPIGLALLVEDEPAVRRLAERTLRKAGLEVIAVGSAEDALAVLDHPTMVRLSVLVSDVMLPGLDGPGLLGAIRARRPDLLAVLLSGFADAALRERLAAAQAVFLAKPYSQAELAEVVLEMLL